MPKQKYNSIHLRYNHKGTVYNVDFETDMNEGEVEAMLINGSMRGHNTPTQLREYARDKGFYVRTHNETKERTAETIAEYKRDSSTTY